MGATIKAVPLRVAAIAFLNPAPLLYNFEHPPAADELRTRYTVHYTTPAQCAAELHAGDADLGLIPIAELTPDLAIVPGCTIASLAEVRSILLLVRLRNHQTAGEALRNLRTIAADSASRSSTAYLRVLLQRFYGNTPVLVEHAADPLTMLAAHDAALLIGDPALLAREHRASIDAAIPTSATHDASTQAAPVDTAPPDTLLWLDIAQLWRQHTGLPWVAAVWAVRPEALLAPVTPQAPQPAAQPAVQLIADLNESRAAGTAHIEELVAEWSQRLPLRAETIHTYLTQNIHYHLDEACLEAIRVFRRFAAECEVLPPLPELRLLTQS